MKSKVKKLEGTARKIDINVSKKTVDNMFNQVIEDIRKTAKIPGFRDGKAPMDMVLKRYNSDAMDEVQRRLIPLGYQHALTEHKIDPVSYPQFSDVGIGAAGDMSFVAHVDIYPDINVKKHKLIKVKKPEVTVEEKEVNETLDRFKNMNAEFVDIDGALEKGNYGICDVETFVGEEAVSKKRENMWIEVDKDASMLGMGEGLIGLKKGDIKDIAVVLPENYPDKKYAGAKATFKVEVKECKKKVLPEEGDDFAKKIGKPNMQEVKSEIRQQLTDRKEENAAIDMKNQIMRFLLDKNAFDVPQSMVQRQAKVLMERAEHDLLSKGVSKEAVEEHKEKLEKEIGKEAIDKVRLYFILDSIASKEGIEITEGDVDLWIAELAKNYNKPQDEVKKYYEDNGLMDGLREQLREDKTLEFLLKESTVS